MCFQNLNLFLTTKEKYFKKNNLDPKEEGKSFNITKKMKDEINKLAKTEKGLKLIEKEKEQRWKDYDTIDQQELLGWEYREKDKSWFDKKYDKYVGGYDAKKEKEEWLSEKIRKDEEREEQFKRKYEDEYEVIRRRLTDEENAIREQFEKKEKELTKNDFTDSFYAKEGAVAYKQKLKKEKEARYAKLNAERRKRFKPLADLTAKYEDEANERAYSQINKDIDAAKAASSLPEEEEDEHSSALPQPAPMSKIPGAPRDTNDRSSGSSWQGGDD